MLDFANQYLRENWAVIEAAPVAFVMAVLIGGAICYWLGKRAVTSPAGQSNGNVLTIGRSSTAPINQSYTHVAPKRWRPSEAEVDRIAASLRGASEIEVLIVGGHADLAIGQDVVRMLQARGANIARSATCGALSPPPDGPISIRRHGALTELVIAPSVQAG